MIAFILSVYFINFLVAPFPRWLTYFKLWKCVLFSYSDFMPFNTRLLQAWFLLKYVLFSPILTFLWYLDLLIYPKYKHQHINPVFIIGTGRSGTTFLHRTLANDKSVFFAIRHIEWRYPFITIHKLIKFFHLQAIFYKKNYWPNNEIGNKAKKMHANTLGDWEEDGIFFEERFLHHMFVWMRFPYLKLLDSLDSFDTLPLKTQSHMIQIHKQVIQKFMYLKGSGKIYLSKENCSHKKLKWFAKIYPDAKFIISVRQSQDFMSSLVNLVQVSILTKSNLDIFVKEQLKFAFIERMQKDCVTLLEFISYQILQKKIYISYRDLVKDTKSTIKYLYHELGISVSDEYKAKLQQVQIVQKDRDRGYKYINEEFKGFEELDDMVNSIKSSSTVKLMD